MKKNNTGETVAEIKKERLKKHLNKEVPNLIQEWVKQLNAPEPFAYMDHDIWGWQSPYRPILKQDPDSNHILRRHLRSRALWRYHTDWEGKLDTIFKLVKQIQKRADEKIGQPQSRQYTHDYRGTALWQAFNCALEQKLAIPYHTNQTSGGAGLRYGAFLLEGSASSEEQRAAIEEEHHHLIWDLTFQLPEMAAIAKEWQEVVELSKKMQDLATKALKEGDIFYPCRFCRRLW